MQVIEKGQCRNIKSDMHDPNGSHYCSNCKHYSLTDNSMICECCSLKIKSRRKFTELKTFQKIVDANRESIESWMAWPCEPDFNYGWVVRIGIINYFVPVRYLAEYLELPELEGEDIVKQFLENVRRECTVLGRYMQAIK